MYRKREKRKYGKLLIIITPFPYSRGTINSRVTTSAAVGCRRARISCVCLYLYFQAVPASSFSLTPCLLLFVLVSCFVPSSVSLVHNICINICTNFQASVQANRNLVLRLVSRETIAIEGSIGKCRSSGCRTYTKVSGYQDIRISRYYDNMIRTLR